MCVTSQGGRVVFVAHHPGGDDERQTLDQRALGGKPVDFGQLVPQVRIAPEIGGDRLQRVAGLDNVHARGRTLRVGVHAIVSKIEIGGGCAGGRAIAKRAGPANGGATRALSK